MDNFSNVIILRSVYGANGSVVYIQPCPNPRTGRLPEHVRPVDANGQIILTEAERDSGKIYIPQNKNIKIETGKSFNLEDPYDLADWEAIKFCPLIVESRDARDSTGRLLIDGDGSQPGYIHTEESDRKARYGMAEFYIERPGVVQENVISKDRKIHMAKTYVYDDSDAGRKRMCKILGRNMTYQTDADALEFLINMCSTHPQKMIDLYTGSDLALRLLFVEAIEKKVIKRANSAYFYNEVLLGGSEDAVLSWMKEPRNKSILAMIKKEVLPDVYTFDSVEAEKAVADKEIESKSEEAKALVKEETAKTTTKTSSSTATKTTTAAKK